MICGRWRCLRRRSGRGCRGDALPAGSAARLSGGSECHVPSATRRSGAGGARGAGSNADPVPATLIARRHGVLAERRDPWRGDGRLPRPSGKGSDDGLGRAGWRRGPAAGRQRPRRAPSRDSQARPRRRAATAGSALAEAGSGGRSHPLPRSAPGLGSAAPGGPGGARAAAGPLIGGRPSQGGRRDNLLLLGLLCPLSLNS